MPGLKPVALPARTRLRRHLHAQAYATIILSGGYEEAGDAGRHRVGAGEVLVHAPFSAHRDSVGEAHCVVLDLPLPFDGRSWCARALVADADEIVRLAERDVAGAADLLLATMIVTGREEDELADRLALALARDGGLSIGEWAERRGRPRESVSRAFRHLYGIDAAAFRAEARARRAWRMIMASEDSLVEIALKSGHSDQAHLTRAVKRLTQRTPGAWRHASHRFKTASRPPP